MTLAPPPIDPDKARVDNFLERLARLPSHRVASEVQRFLDEQRRMDVSEKYKRILAQAIIAKIKAAGREKASQEKVWYQDLLLIANS
ncbi:MAG TPA: hypothetical protein PKE45_13395, partial [Caldilineaceae bacterium]|nr:hypothetical protein [Caldilineaceae bacterium]